MMPSRVGIFIEGPHRPAREDHQDQPAANVRLPNPLDPADFAVEAERIRDGAHGTDAERDVFFERDA